MWEEVVPMLADGVCAGIPLYLAAVGEVVAERSGVINVGIEGIMLLGGMLGVAIQVRGGSAIVAIGCAASVGCLVAFIFGLLTIVWRVNQIAAGIAIIFLGKGVSALQGARCVGEKTIRLPVMGVPILKQIPIAGKIFFQHNLLTYFAFLSIPLLALLMYRSRWGLLVRATGEDPAAAERAGVNVRVVRLLAVSFGGVFAGIAGAHLSMGYANTWKEDMIAGRGLIAVALAIFAGWDPVRSAIGALLFAIFTTLAFHLQVWGVEASSYFLNMLPFAMTLIVLVLASTQAIGQWGRMPRALGRPYTKGEDS